MEHKYYFKRRIVKLFFNGNGVTTFAKSYIGKRCIVRTEKNKKDKVLKLSKKHSHKVS